MTPTRPRTLLLLALLAGGVAYVLFRARYGDLPPVPRTVALTTFVLAVAELFMAPSLRARLDGRPRTKPILPIAVARTAAFAKASSAIGAPVAGFMLGVEAYVLGRLDLAAAKTDAVSAGLAVASSVLLVVAALRLEGVCRVPPPPPEAEPGP
jgi:hypothetical protein